MKNWNAESVMCDRHVTILPVSVSHILSILLRNIFVFLSRSTISNVYLVTYASLDVQVFSLYIVKMLYYEKQYTTQSRKNYVIVLKKNVNLS